MSALIIVLSEQSASVAGPLNSWVLNYLGDEGETPEFKTFSWAAMPFCCGVSAGVFYWGFIE